MANNFIYVYEDGSYDYSRWLNISLRPKGVAMLHLADLCHPGMLSALSSVSGDVETMTSSLAAGALQITLPTGYFLATREGDLLSLEFKSYDDLSPCRVTLLASDVQRRLEALASQTNATVR